VLADGDYEIDPDQNAIMFPDVLSPSIVEGGKYTVTIEGEAFEDVGATADVDGLGVVCIGNPAVFGLGDDNGKPYFMFVLADAGMVSAIGMYGQMAIVGLDDTTVHLSIIGTAETTVKIPEKYIPDAKNSFLVNGSAIGSIRTVFSSGENDEYKIGDYAFAEGEITKASGKASHAEGTGTVASGVQAHAEGGETVASGQSSHAEGDQTVASGIGAHAEGYATKASGWDSHAEGWETVASGNYAHSEGKGTVAASKGQHVQGVYNIEDAANKYAHIVGNGESDTARSNAHTVDWDGNAWYQGYVEGTKLILPSPNGTRWAITVGDDGTLSAAAVTE